MCNSFIELFNSSGFQIFFSIGGWIFGLLTAFFGSYFAYRFNRRINKQDRGFQIKKELYVRAWVFIHRCSKEGNRISKTRKKEMLVLNDEMEFWASEKISDKFKELERSFWLEGEPREVVPSEDEAAIRGTKPFDIETTKTLVLEFKKLLKDELTLKF